MSYTVDDHNFDDLYTTINYIRWCKHIRDLTITKIYKEAFVSKYNAYFYCLDFKYLKHRVENFIIKNNDPKFAFLFYRDILNCRKKKLIKIMSNSTKYFTKFSIYIDNSFIKKAEKCVIEKNDYCSALLLLKEMKYCNESKLIDLVIKFGKPRYLISLSKIYKNNKEIILKIQNRLMELKSYRQLTYLAVNNNFTDVNKIEEFIRSSGELSDVLFFANKVERSDLSKLLIFA